MFGTCSSPIMENVESFILEGVYRCRNHIFGRKKSKFATTKRQRMWEDIHLQLIDNGFVLPNKPWTSTRCIWYRMVSTAKASHRKYTAGLQEYLHHQDKKVLEILGIPIVPPTTSRITENDDNVVEEQSSTIRLECFDILEEEDSPAYNLSQMTDMELKKALLLQELKLNEYKLLKMKYYFFKIGNGQIYEEFLRQIET